MLTTAVDPELAMGCKTQVLARARGPFEPFWVQWVHLARAGSNLPSGWGHPQPAGLEYH